MIYLLRSFGVQEAPLKTFYDSFVTSAIIYGRVSWRSSITTTDRTRPDKLIRRASCVHLDPLEVVGE